MAAPLPPRRRAPTFQPRFALSLIYFFGFFAFFSFALVMPELLNLLQGMPPGPEQEEAARALTREVLRGKLPYVVVLTLLATGLGGYFKVLPGLRVNA